MLSVYYVNLLLLGDLRNPLRQQVDCRSFLPGFRQAEAPGPNGSAWHQHFLDGEPSVFYYTLARSRDGFPIARAHYRYLVAFIVEGLSEVISTPTAPAAPRWENVSEEPHVEG